MSKITIDDCLVIHGLKIIKGPGEEEGGMDGAGVRHPLVPPIGPLSAAAEKGDSAG